MRSLVLASGAPHGWGKEQGEAGGAARPLLLLPSSFFLLSPSWLSGTSGPGGAVVGTWEGLPV